MRQTHLTPLPSLVLSLFVATCVLVTAAHAQEEDTIVPERPGFSSSPLALDPGRWQFEAGYEYLTDDDPLNVDASTLPFLLVRYGLIDNVEAQFAWSGYTWLDVGPASADGANDASLGVKWQLRPRESRTPVAVFAGVSLPFGSNAFSSDDVDPALGLFWTHDAAIDFFGTVGLRSVDGDRSLSNAVGISLPLSERVGGYVEYFGLYDEGQGPQHLLNAGLAMTPERNLQFDLYAGFGLNERAPDFFVGFGVAYRPEF